MDIKFSVLSSIRPSVDGIVSALYLQQYSLPITSYQATSEGVSRVTFYLQNSKIWILCNFDFVLFWDQIWINIIGNHGAAGGILRTKAF